MKTRSYIYSKQFSVLQQFAGNFNAAIRTEIKSEVERLLNTYSEQPEFIVSCGCIERYGDKEYFKYLLLFKNNTKVIEVIVLEDFTEQIAKNTIISVKVI